MTAQTPAQAALRASLAASAPRTATRLRDLIATASAPFVAFVACPACALPLDFSDQPHPCTDQDDEPARAECSAWPGE